MHYVGNPVRALVERRARDSSERTAYVEGATGKSLTWGSVADGVAGWDALGASAGPHARAGLLAGTSLEMVKGFLAALAAGVVIAPLDPGASPAELAGQAARLGLSVIVTDEAGSGLGAGLEGVDHWLLGDRGPQAVPAQRPAQAQRPGPASPPPDGLDGLDVAMIMASSGTTGTPKIIPLSASQLLDTAAGVASAHQLDDRATGYSPLPLFHINGLVVGVLATLVTGGRLVVDRRFSAGRFWKVVADYGVTWLNLVPAIISILAQRQAPPAEVAGRVGFARSASAPLPTPVRADFEQRTGISVLETYGMTEAASQITANPRDPAARRPGSVGLPVDVALRVVDRDRRPVPAGDVGQVQIRGTRVVARYWSPADDAGGSRPATGPDGWLATGDLGWMDADGYVYLVGRLDDVINRGGEKVFPLEVEGVLLADAAVASAAVVGRPHPVVGEEPIAFVLPAPDADVDGLAERLSQRCQAGLSRFKRPAEIIVADSLPAGPTGKIRHAELRAALAGDDAPNGNVASTAAT